MSAKETGNMAATAKRSATAIQRLARCLDDLTAKEKTALAEAAEILEKHGNRAKNKAAGEKRAEQIRERAQRRAFADQVRARHGIVALAEKWDERIGQ